MMDRDYTIKVATRDEVNVAVQWAADEGWNPGLHDADCYYRADSEGFLVGLLGEKPVATISAFRYGQTFGFIGFYIVKPAYRGQGYGIKIWQAAMQRLQGRNVGLDGVVAQKENYKKSGFKLAYRNIRYAGTGGGDAPEDANIVALSSVSFETIKSYDQPFFPEARPEFLRSWINQPESIASGIMKNGKLAGYGVMRRCRQGYKVGPLLADSPDLAEALFVALKSKAKRNEPVFLDTPEVNPAAVSLAKRHNMEVVFETARMYTGPKTDLPLDRLFGVTSFEIG